LSETQFLFLYYLPLSVPSCLFLSPSPPPWNPHPIVFESKCECGVLLEVCVLVDINEVLPIC
jgi:hypothetical protein